MYNLAIRKCTSPPPPSSEVENVQIKIDPAGDWIPDLLNQRQICYHLSQRGELTIVLLLFASIDALKEYGEVLFPVEEHDSEVRINWRFGNCSRRGRRCTQCAISTAWRSHIASSILSLGNNNIFNNFWRNWPSASPRSNSHIAS